MNDYIFELKNISKRFGSVEVLHRVSLSLRAGEIHALLGENGAGKSTLVKIMTGVHRPDSGEIYLGGAQVHFSSTRDSRDMGIAAIYQELSLFPDLDVAENIFVGRQPTSRSGRIDWSRIYKESASLLALLGVDLDLKTKARQLSKAQQQMVEIARAFSINARILIMDEPTSSLTLNEVADLFRVVRRLRDQGTAVVFISHRLEELFELADFVTVLRDGNYVDTRPMNEISRDELIRLMVGRSIANLYPTLNAQSGKTVLQVIDLSNAGLFEKVSFELRSGEILGLAGLVGSGRTDLARAVFGVEQPTGGTILVDGQDVKISSPQQAIRLGLAYVPEDRQVQGLIPAMDIVSNVSLPILREYSRLGWLRAGAERTAVFGAARQMEVRANNIRQKAHELSGGNQQKVVLAKWLSTRPRILILDEPTRGIDVGTKVAVHALMSKLAGQGMAILMISSELPEILGMSDRVLVMREGHITAHFTRAEATKEKILSAATQAVGMGAAQ